MDSVGFFFCCFCFFYMFNLYVSSTAHCFIMYICWPVIPKSINQSINFISVCDYMYMCLTVMFHLRGREPYADQMIVVWGCIWIRNEISRKLKYFKVAALIATKQVGSTNRSRLFFCCSSSSSVCQQFHIGRSFCHYLFLITPSFGASGELNFMVVALLIFLRPFVYMFSKTSVARTSLGPWNSISDLGSSSHSGLMMAPGQKASCNNPGYYFCIFYTIMVCWVYLLELHPWGDSNEYTQNKISR